MNRLEWLKKKRLSAEDRYDRLWAPIYDDNWGAEIDPLHHRFVTEIVNSCPEDGIILDAACGTGKYWPILIASGRKFTAIDQSQGMLDHAVGKYPQIKVRKLGLQEMDFENAFDLIICMDAMEMVFPEDWLRVLRNFHRALKQNGQLYFTVEVADPTEIEKDYQAGINLSLPIVLGESIFADEDRKEESGYHYYPGMDKVRQWLNEVGFVIKDEAENGYYHHFWTLNGS